MLWIMDPSSVKETVPSHPLEFDAVSANPKQPPIDRDQFGGALHYNAAARAQNAYDSGSP
jgi:hypothetical protein